MSDRMQWLINFKRPKNKVELMERVAEWALEEDRWTKSMLCRAKPNAPYLDEYQAIDDSILGEMEGAEICESVGACLMGIMGIAFDNGRMVRRALFSSFNERDNHGFVWAAGVNALFQALPEADRKAAQEQNRSERFDYEKQEWVSEYVKLTTAMKIDAIEGFNDDGETEHVHIVQITQRALEIAKS